MKNISEETRKKMSASAKARCDDNWRKSMSERYSTKLDTNAVREMYEGGMSQTEIAEAFGVSQKVIWKHMKNNGIKARTPAKRNQSKEDNHMWKGDSASYSSFHLRVYKQKGKAKAYGCSICGTKDESLSYDWANLSGHYEDINDYAPMCRACHRRYDKSRKEGDQNA